MVEENVLNAMNPFTKLQMQFGMLADIKKVSSHAQITAALRCVHDVCIYIYIIQVLRSTRSRQYLSHVIRSTLEA